MFEAIVQGLKAVRQAIGWVPDDVIAVLIMAVAAAAALSLHEKLRTLVRRAVADRYPYLLSLFSQTKGVSRLALLIVALTVAVAVAPLDHDTAVVMARLLLLAVVALIGWAAIAALNLAADFYLMHFRLDVEDMLARKHVTQIRILLRVADTLIVVVTISAALMTFEPVRQYGVSLFASAGVAGIVAGLAARPVLSNLLAGVQLAMTQPIRIGDQVVVEKESGHVEEITSTYVVVRLWDWRRLIVPLNYFIEQPFQNWTREDSELIGSVTFHLDYTAPVEAIRAKLKEIVEQSGLWNGKTFSVQVIDAKENTIELRVLVSANSATATWDLRCEVRERLIDFLQKQYPHALPRHRTEAIQPAESSHGVHASKPKTPVERR